MHTSVQRGPSGSLFARPAVLVLLPFAVPLLIAAAATDARAQTSATATITFEVRPISEFALSGSPKALSVSAAVPGADPTPAVDATTTWSITTNEVNRKVTAAIEPLPEGIALGVSMAGPGGAFSAGTVWLGTDPRDLVTGISNVQASGLPIIYTLTATTSAGVVNAAATVVTFTITTGA